MEQFSRDKGIPHKKAAFTFKGELNLILKAGSHGDTKHDWAGKSDSEE